MPATKISPPPAFFCCYLCAFLDPSSTLSQDRFGLLKAWKLSAPSRRSELQYSLCLKEAVIIDQYAWQHPWDYCVDPAACWLLLASIIHSQKMAREPR